jgi:hypothetical protein
MLLERLQDYLDYDAIARDLSLDYSETTHRRNATGLPQRIGSPPGHTAGPASSRAAHVSSRNTNVLN